MSGFICFQCVTKFLYIKSIIAIQDIFGKFDIMVILGLMVRPYGIEYLISVFLFGLSVLALRPCLIVFIYLFFHFLSILVIWFAAKNISLLLYTVYISVQFQWIYLVLSSFTIVNILEKTTNTHSCLIRLGLVSFRLSVLMTHPTFIQICWCSSFRALRVQKTLYKYYDNMISCESTKVE